MSFVAVIDHTQVGDARVAIKRMLAEVPAETTETVVCGRYELGVAHHSERRIADIGSAYGLTVAMVGTLDNLSDLAGSLPCDSLGMESRSRAETLARVFQCHGEATPAMLRGTFAVIVTDGEKLWCFRDHLGFESLFYATGPHFTCAASEAKQVIAGGGLAKQPDLEFIDQIFLGMAGDETRTAFRGVTRLPKRCLLKVNGAGALRSEYWHPDDLLEQGPSDIEEVKTKFHKLMTQAVERSLTGHDVILLSGGLDSPTVAAFAAPLHLQMSGRPLTALSHVYPDYPAVDERPYIEVVARHLGLPLNTYVPEFANLTRLQDWVRALDGPWQGWVPFGAEEQFRAASDLGFSSILTGELAEFVIDKPKHLISHLLLNGRPAAAMHHLARQRDAGARIPVLARQVLRTFLPRPVMAAYKRIRPGISSPDWLDRRMLARQQSDRALPVRERWTDQQTAFIRGPGLSMEAHSLLQARAGVRMRSPWADVDLWEFFLSLPAEVKYPDHRHKALVREMVRGKLPEAIVDRPDKTVFTDFVTARIDYQSLRRWLVKPAHRLRGVDYEMLAEHLEDQNLSTLGYIWAKDLAIIHAFLALW